MYTTLFVYLSAISEKLVAAKTFLSKFQIVQELINCTKKCFNGKLVEQIPLTLR